MFPKLAEYREIGCALRPAARQEQCRSDGDDDGGNLGDKTIAHRQYRVGLEGLRDRHVVHRDAHDKAGDQIEHGDQEPRDGITFYEFGCPVERPEEGRLLLFSLSAFLGFDMRDGPRGHVAVDGKLFARHAIQRKPCADLRHPCGAFRDHHEVDDQQDAEHHETEKNASAHHKLREAFDHIARGVGSRMALSDDEFG